MKNIVSANVPMETLSKLSAMGGTVARCVVTSARNHSRRTIRESAIGHLTGRYRDSLHSNCNLNYKNSFYIQIVFHNLSDYDAHN